MLLATAPFALAEDTAAEAEAPAADLTPVLLVTVNGEEIMSDNSTLTMAYANYIQTAQNYGMDVSSEDVDTMLKQYSMQYTIQYTLILQKAKELGLDTVTDEEKAEIEASVRESWNLGVQGVVDQMGTVTAESTGSLYQGKLRIHRGLICTGKP